MSTVLEGTRKPSGSLAKLEDHQIRMYEEAIRAGMPRTTAVKFLGVVPETWSEARRQLCQDLGYDWESISLDDIETILNTNKKLKPREKNILKILAIEKGPADAEGELNLLLRLRKAAEDPKLYPAAIALLKMTRGYTDKQIIEHTGETTNTIQIVWGEKEKQLMTKHLSDAGAKLPPELEATLVEDEEV